MYKNIMAPLDGSELAESVLPHVKAFIKGFDASDVVLVRVLEPDSTSVIDDGEGDFKNKLLESDKKRIRSAKAYLDGVGEGLSGERVKAHTEVLFGKPVDSLIDYIESHDIDLIVIVTHGRSGVTRWIMGSVAEKLFRSVKISIFIVRAPHLVGSGPVINDGNRFLPKYADIHESGSVAGLGGQHRNASNKF